MPIKSISFFVLLLLLNTYLTNKCSKNLFNGPIPQKAIDSIVRDINLKRQRLSIGKETSHGKNLPQISNMVQMYWNEKLAEKAQSWADELIKKCIFKHTPSPYIGSEGYPVGENISKNIELVMKKPNPELAFKKSVSKWWAEKEHCKFKKLDDYEFDFFSGHFTELAWAETDQIGCGYVAYSDQRYPYNEIVVCNFARVGNLIHAEALHPGKACSQCPFNLPCSKQYPGICGNGVPHKEISHYDFSRHRGERAFGPEPRN